MTLKSTNIGMLKSPGAGMVALGLASLFLGVFTAVPALVWSRRLRPFDRATRVGYCICLLALTSYSAAALLLYFLGAGFLLDWQYQVAAFVVCAAIWLALAAKLISRPAPSIFAAILISLSGSLLTAPALLIGSWGVKVLPTAAGIAWFAFGRTDASTAQGLVYQMDAVAWLYASLPTVGAFLGFLAVYWPGKECRKQEKM